MDASLIETETFEWAIGLGVGFPAAMLVLGELILRLRRAGRPLATTLANLRSTVVPLLALVVLMVRVVGLSPEDELVRIASTGLWIAIIHAALGFINDVVFADPVEGTWQSHVPKLFLDLARFIIVMIGGAVVFSRIWRVDLSHFVTALGVGSLVLGLALQEPLGNVFAGVMLMFERPLSVGDWINVDSTTGRVVEINWRAVHLETSTFELLVVPNSKLAKGNLSNYSRPDRRHTESILLAFSCDDPPNKVKRVLVDAAMATPGILHDPPPKATTTEIADAKVTYKISFTVLDFAETGQARDDLLTRVWYVARRHGLSVPPGTTAGESKGHDLAGLLAEFPQFSLKGTDDPSSIAPRLDLKTFGKGEVVIPAGRKPAGLHLILSGSAALAIEGADGLLREVAHASAGEFFGETSVLSGEPSELTVTAIDDLEVILLDSKTLQAILDKTPRLARQIGTVMDVRHKAASAARTLTTPRA